MKNLSIIIPVYNVAPYLRECLDSVFITNNFEGEVICINDGSTDESGKILDEYATQYTNLKVLTQENQGLSVTRNNGISIATREYIYFLDSDDYLLPNAIASITELTKNNPTTQFFYTDCAIDDINKINSFPFEEDILFTDASKSYDTLYNTYHYTPVAPIVLFIYKREIFQKYNLMMEKGRFYEDELQTFKIFCCDIPCFISHITNPWYYYRTEREGAITHSTRLKNLVDSMAITRLMYQKMIEADLATPARKSKVFNMIVQTIIMGYDSCYKKEYKLWFNDDDIRMMQYCIQNEYEKKLYTIARIHPNLMAAYKCDKLPSLIRKAINRFI